MVDDRLGAEGGSCARPPCPPAEPHVLGQRLPDAGRKPVLEAPEPLEELARHEHVGCLVQAVLAANGDRAVERPSGRRWVGNDLPLHQLGRIQGSEPRAQPTTRGHAVGVDEGERSRRRLLDAVVPSRRRPAIRLPYQPDPLASFGDDASRVIARAIVYDDRLIRSFHVLRLERVEGPADRRAGVVGRNDHAHPWRWLVHPGQAAEGTCGVGRRGRDSLERPRRRSNARLKSCSPNLFAVAKPPSRRRS